MPAKTFNLLSNRRQLISLNTCSQTKVLNVTVCISAKFHPVKIRNPAKLRTKVTTSCRMAWPKIIFHILNVIIEAPLASGFLLRSSSVGGSVASANAAKVSMIKLTQRS